MCLIPISIFISASHRTVRSPMTSAFGFCWPTTSTASPIWPAWMPTTVRCGSCRGSHRPAMSPLTTPAASPRQTDKTSVKPAPPDERTQTSADGTAITTTVQAPSPSHFQQVSGTVRLEKGQYLELHSLNLVHGSIVIQEADKT